MYYLATYGILHYLQTAGTSTRLIAKVLKPLCWPHCWRGSVLCGKVALLWGSSGRGWASGHHLSVRPPPNCTLEPGETPPTHLGGQTGQTGCGNEEGNRPPWEAEDDLLCDLNGTEPRQPSRHTGAGLHVPLPLEQTWGVSETSAACMNACTHYKSYWLSIDISLTPTKNI